METLHILGGGPAGLAAGHYAGKAGFPFKLYESSGKTGGNAVTLKHGDFFFDSGAHRLHDKIREVTQECIALLGGALKEVQAPNQIFHEDRFIDFPLSPLNLLKKLGPVAFFNACRQVFSQRLMKKSEAQNFEAFALQAYGLELSKRFLLGYSEKLWGLPCRELSPAIAGPRLGGLTLRSFILEALFGKKAKTHHLEGSRFYYPDFGIGMIAKALEQSCGVPNVFKGSRITRIFHDQKKITGMEVNGSVRIDTSFMINTLPLPLFLKMMDPSPPDSILKIAGELRFRNMILCLLTLDKKCCSNNATVYFPDADCVFTRVYEPRNRSLWMSPPGKTSLVAEIPCWANDTLWREEESTLTERVCSQLLKTGWFRREQIIDTRLVKFSHAYPVLDVGFEGRVRTLLNYLETFPNLRVAGRNGKFTYTSIHHMMASGKELIDELGDIPNTVAEHSVELEPVPA